MVSQSEERDPGCVAMTELDPPSSASEAEKTSPPSRGSPPAYDRYERHRAAAGTSCRAVW